ncbi:Dabb family protein [Ruminococcus albus]|uniref:Stress responsive A/B Barrel Domain n=1 Tax=Ruminococcus albus TaxID=1264 RepID=A0A1H7IW92_RUMAL|nr:Dabb family protein [Ruminococcus albus]SEK65075.1 Stress responsive A/B Barrel Domain [Ruminococcus albus]
MIRHICMFKLKNENKDALIKEFLERAESLKTIPQLKRYEVVYNDKRTPDSNYDVSLIFDFDSVEDLNAYQSSETHINFGKFVATVKEERACIDYEF